MAPVPYLLNHKELVWKTGIEVAWKLPVYEMLLFIDVPRIKAYPCINVYLWTILIRSDLWSCIQKRLHFSNSCMNRGINRPILNQKRSKMAIFRGNLAVFGSKMIEKPHFLCLHTYMEIFDFPGYPKEDVCESQFSVWTFSFIYYISLMLKKWNTISLTFSSVRLSRAWKRRTFKERRFLMIPLVGW